MVIKNGVVVDVNGQREVDIRIEDGKIVSIGKGLSDIDEIDAKGKIVMPALVDLNVRLKDNRLNAANMSEASSDAAKGGVLTLFISPDMNPRIDNEIVLEFIASHSRELKDASIRPLVCSLNEQGELSNIATLLKLSKTTMALSSDIDSNRLRRLFEYAIMHENTLFIRLFDAALDSDGVMHEGEVANRLGLHGLTPLSEIIHIAKIIEMSRFFKVSVLIQGVTTMRGLEMIERAKSEGVEIFSEVSLHHLILNDEACENFNVNAKIFPPLRDEENRKEILNALKSGKIDTLTGLHSPQSRVNKDVAFNTAAYGTETMADLLPLYYTNFVKTGDISLNELIRIGSQMPAKMVGMNLGEISEGSDAKLVLFDENERYTINNRNSLYNGKEIYGKVVKVVL